MDYRDMMNELLEVPEDELSVWETDFITNMDALVDNTKLTENQEHKIEELYNRHVLGTPEW